MNKWKRVLSLIFYLFVFSLEDDGCQSMLRVLLKNNTLELLHLGSNNVTHKSAPLLAQVCYSFLFFLQSVVFDWVYYYKEFSGNSRDTEAFYIIII